MIKLIVSLLNNNLLDCFANARNDDNDTVID
jgi:hypothetical protein